jgi:hypothetical protein
MILLMYFHAIVAYESQLKLRDRKHQQQQHAEKQAENETLRALREFRSCEQFYTDADSLVGMIAKPMNRFAACGDPRAEKR